MTGPKKLEKPCPQFPCGNALRAKHGVPCRPRTPMHAREVFWIVDNGSSHRGTRACALTESLSSPHARPRARPCQIEIYFSIVQRKVLTPNDFATLDAVAERLLDFQSLLRNHCPAL